LNFSEYIRIELVLAVPDVPISMTALLHKLDLLYLRIESKMMFALNESKVGIKV